MIRLYDYYRASSCYRVRIALYLKGLDFESVSVDLLGGVQREPDYRAVNPQGVVPYLIDGDVEISQSLAMIEYLDEVYPQAPLVFGSASEKAYIRQMALLVACDIHPFGNPKVWKGYLMQKAGFSEEQAMAWMHHWMAEGLGAYEALLEKSGKAGALTCGDAPSMADLCLIPQLYNARRFGLDLSGYPRILEIEKAALALEGFQRAAPERHQDAPLEKAG